MVHIGSESIGRESALRGAYAYCVPQPGSPCDKVCPHSFDSCLLLQLNRGAAFVGGKTFGHLDDFDGISCKNIGSAATACLSCTLYIHCFQNSSAECESYGNCKISMPINVLRVKIIEKICQQTDIYRNINQHHLTSSSSISSLPDKVDCLWRRRE